MVSQEAAEAAYREDLNGEYTIDDADVQFYEENGFIRLKQVFQPATLKRVREEITAAVQAADAKPLEDDDAYARAFLQVMNIWLTHDGVRNFCLGTKLARIAARLMKTSGVRMYHDQALYKQPHGGPTPFHADQFYWPLDTNKTITAWIPLQAVPLEMGALEFAAGSHKVDLGRSLNISGDNDALIARRVAEAGFPVTRAPFDLGEVSFHSGWTFHRADGNATDRPRQVMTIIMMDEDARVTEPQHDNHRADMQRFLPGLRPGDLAASPRNPVLWSAKATAS